MYYFWSKSSRIVGVWDVVNMGLSKVVLIETKWLHKYILKITIVERKNQIPKEYNGLNILVYFSFDSSFSGNIA